MVQNTYFSKLSLTVAALLFFNLAGCATERTAAGEPIEEGTVEYGISTAERDKLYSIPILFRFWQDKHISALGQDPNDARIIEINLDYDLQTAKSLFIRSFEEIGQEVLQHRSGMPFDYKAIENLDYAGKINAGFLDLNFAVFLVEFHEMDKSTKISILAISFEGLVKQNTIGAATERLISSIEAASGNKVNWQ